MIDLEPPTVDSQDMKPAVLVSAGPTDPRVSALGLGALRVVLGIMWLSNVVWKRPPDFGRPDGGALYRYVNDAVEFPVFAPFSWVMERLVLPNFQAFGWLVLVTETALAVLLLVGAYTRLAALIGIGMSVAIGLSVLAAPNEWPWSYLLMVIAHVAVGVSSAGRFGGVDGVRWARSRPGPGGGPTAARQLTTWGALALLVGGLTALLGDGRPSDHRTELGSTTWQLNVGSFNLVAGLILLVVGALMLFAARRSDRRAAVVAAALAVLAAGSITAQVGFTDVWLGGNASTAGTFLVLAAAAALLGRLLGDGAVVEPARSAASAPRG